MPDNFYVAEKIGSDPAEYVTDMNSNNLPVFSTDRNSAVWSASEAMVQSFINRFQIANVKPKSEGGNHPPRPSLSA